MHVVSDMDLLRDYDRNGSQAAFAELVQRHLALVYSAALRHVANAAHAEEITQAVFIILARKGGGLRANTILESWLYETTRLTALSFLRDERRRQFREQEVYMQSTLSESNHDAIWQQLAPLLDEAMSRLNAKDRDAVMLRFFKDQSVRDVAVAMRISESAAQRRLLRAVEKLRSFFTKHGITVPASVLTATISANSIQAAPIALAKSVTAVAIAKGVVASASTLTLIKGALKIMAWTKMKMAIVIGACVVLTTGTTAIIIYNQEKPLQSIPKDWSALSGDIEDWAWANGKINGHCTNGDSILSSGKEYRDITLSATVATTNREASLAIRMQDANNGYIIVFGPKGTPREDTGDAGQVVLLKRLSGSETALASYHGRIFSSIGQSAKITVIAKGSIIEVRLNDMRVLRVMDTTFASGLIGFRMYGSADYPCDATFSKVNF